MGMPAPRYFNSIKVRLKPDGYYYKWNVSTFQFHKGTIKTIRIVAKQIKITNFNSIKVRLKHAVSHSFEFHN